METQLVVIALLVLDKAVDESDVFDELLVNDMLANERVLHKIVVVDEWCRVAKQLVRAVVDTVMDCTESDGCCSLK
ncbi:hypothetical protein Tco_0165970, partial [Tanacetum coccineum]